MLRFRVQALKNPPLCSSTGSSHLQNQEGDSQFFPFSIPGRIRVGGQALFSSNSYTLADGGGALILLLSIAVQVRVAVTVAQAVTMTVTMTMTMTMTIEVLLLPQMVLGGEGVGVPVADVQ
jgi:hypothetical protein